ARRAWRASEPPYGLGSPMYRQDQHRDSQRGAGRLKAVFWLAVLAAVAYVGIKLVPVLLNEYQFQDAMQTTARMATVTRQTPDAIRKTLFEEAQREDIPIQPDDIQITNGAGKVTISAEYSVTVDLGVYQWTLNFHPSASNNSL